MTASDRIPRSLYPFDGHRIDVGGHGYHYLDEGSDEGSGEALVMLHGNPTWSFYYRDLVKVLREQHRTLVPDHIGCGLSDKPGDAEYRYTLSQRVDALETFLDQVDAGTAGSPAGVGGQHSGGTRTAPVRPMELDRTVQGRQPGGSASQGIRAGAGKPGRELRGLALGFAPRLARRSHPQAHRWEQRHVRVPRRLQFASAGGATVPRQ